MSARIVTETRHILWDGVTQRLHKGQVIDVPPGGALEREIGAQYLVPMPGTVQPPAEEAAAEAPQEKPAPARSRTAGKKQDDGKDGKP